MVGVSTQSQTCESPYSTNSVVISQCLRVHARKRARIPMGGGGAGGLLRNVSQGLASLISSFVTSVVQRTSTTLVAPSYLDLLPDGQGASCLKCCVVLLPVGDAVAGLGLQGLAHRPRLPDGSGRFVQQRRLMGDLSGCGLCGCYRPQGVGH